VRSSTSDGRARGAVLQRVAYQVLQRQARQAGRTLDDHRFRRHDETDLAPRVPTFCVGDHRPAQPAEVERLALELLRANARKRKQVLDDLLQALCFGAYVLQRLLSLASFEPVAATKEEMAVAHDGRDWRTQLVRDEAQELVLHLH